MLIINATAFLAGRFVPRTSILVRNGKIEAIGEKIDASGDPTLDMGGDYLLPGMVDVHIHAFMGQDVMGGEEAIRHMSRELLKVGIGAFLPTTMSASAQDTLSALAGIKAVMEKPEPHGAKVLGAHMEAPFLNASRAGAQLQEFFAEPNLENWAKFSGEYEDIVRLITLAPDLDGAMPLIRELAKRGITVSLGHTDATADVTREAADNGATHVTHTFNAQSPLLHRDPGVPGAALTDDRFFCEMICDGVHLHPDIVRLILRCKGAKGAVAVTDAMEAAGMPNGQYQLGGQAVFVEGSSARLKDGTLAGSTLTLAKAAQNMIAFGADPADAATVVTETPALSIGNHDMGVIKEGAPAVFARFGQDWRFLETITE